MKGLVSWTRVISLSFMTAMTVGYVMQPTQHDDHVTRDAVSDFVQVDTLISELATALPSPTNVAPSPATPSLCDIEISAQSQPAAMIAVSILAPCAAGDVVKLHHHGMIIATNLDTMGRALVHLPALNREALVIVDGPNVPPTVLRQTVPDADDFGRYVLQWSGPATLRIDPIQSRGNIVRYDFVDTDQHPTRVISYHRDVIAPDLRITTSADHCGKDTRFHVLQVSDAGTRLRDYQITAPACTGSQETLVLKNLYQTATVARK